MTLLWLINVNATFTLHLHGVVTQLFVQVVGGSSSRFACWQGHLDTGCFGTLCLASEHSREEKLSTKNLMKLEQKHNLKKSCGRRAHKLFSFMSQVSGKKNIHRFSFCGMHFDAPLSTYNSLLVNTIIFLQ